MNELNEPRGSVSVRLVVKGTCWAGDVIAGELQMAAPPKRSAPSRGMREGGKRSSSGLRGVELKQDPGCGVNIASAAIKPSKEGPQPVSYIVVK